LPIAMVQYPAFDFGVPTSQADTPRPGLEHPVHRNCSRGFADERRDWLYGRGDCTR
jgi:hypothetical protein